MTGGACSCMPATDDEPTMTGDCFLECLKRAGYSINSAAKRWGVDAATVHREKEKPDARGLYADAARTLLREADAEPPACLGEGA